VAVASYQVENSLTDCAILILQLFRVLNAKLAEMVQF
jgi:hypothetical protein